MFPPPRRADTRPFHRHRAASHSISQNGRSHLEPVTFHPVSKRATSVNLSAAVSAGRVGSGKKESRKKNNRCQSWFTYTLIRDICHLGHFPKCIFCLIRSLNYFHFSLPKTPAWIFSTGVYSDLKHMCTNIPLRLEVDHLLAKNENPINNTFT